MNPDQWWDWCALIQVDDADRAWVPDMLGPFTACYDAYNFDDITEVTQTREHNGWQWQWSRIWCLPTDRYEWRWLPVCETCGSARCQTRH